MPLSAAQRARYARHLLLTEIGVPGQERLLGSAVEIPNATGAGAAAIVYLTAAGVGKLVVTDPGTVEAPDGFLYEETDVGRPRALAISDRVAAQNPDVVVVAAGEVTHRLEVGVASEPFAALELGAREAGRLVRRIARGAR